MAGTKRRRSEENGQAETGAEHVHPARKQRVDDGAVDTELRKIFNDLRDEISITRLEATRNLLRILSSNPDKLAQYLDYSITRLVKGVCSGAKAARPGFSIALAEVLRLGFAADLKLANVVDKAIALTESESKASGEEKRNHLLGRRFALQAILQSGVLTKASEEDARCLYDAIATLSSQKEWLRSECGAMLFEFLKNQEDGHTSDLFVGRLIQSWADQSLLKSPEGAALWLTVKKTFPDVKLPKGVWHHNNPLSGQERPTLIKILLKNAVEVDDTPDVAPKKKSAGARRAAPSFAWQILLNYLYEEDGGRKFSAFWQACVAKQMFSSASSTERKNLGLQIFTQALTTAPVPLLNQVIESNTIRCIVDQRAKPDRYLFEAAKIPLVTLTKRVETEPEAASPILCKLLAVLPPSHDKFTKTTIDSLLSAADPNGLGEIIATVVELCRMPGVEDATEAEKKRRVLADILLGIVRSRRSEPSQFFVGDGESNPANWLRSLLCGLTHLGFTIQDAKISPPLSGISQTVFRERLMSALGHLADLPLHRAIAAPSLIIETLRASKQNLATTLDAKSAAVLKETRKHLKDAAKKANSTTGTTGTVMRAFQLLLALGMLQVYKQEADSVSVLEDIASCYQSPTDDSDASTMIVELLLSFVSKPSALFRKLAEQVFSAFAPEVSSEGLQSMIDILSQKESLAGQQELFDQHDEDGEALQARSNDDKEDFIEIEDDSDVELVNGEVADENDDDITSSSNEDDSSSGEADEDEEAAFDRKLADALGTAGMEAGHSDSDGSDMDDDQMMALEPHLNNIFKERKKMSSGKQDNKEAKENIVNFKNRVLDLLQVYVKSQYGNVLALDLIHPLVSLTRTTSNPSTSKKAMEVLETFFDTCKKHKTLPRLPNAKAGFDLLAAVHAETKSGGSKLHANACSRASQFLAKILVGVDEKHWKQIAGMYITLQDEWRRDAKSKIHGSVFNDWHSWSMQR